MKNFDQNNDFEFSVYLRGDLIKQGQLVVLKPS